MAKCSKCSKSVQTGKIVCGRCLLDGDVLLGEIEKELLDMVHGRPSLNIYEIIDKIRKARGQS